MKYSAIYGRSSLGRERQGDTIEHQIEMIKEYAKRSNIEVAFDDKFIYEDEDSGFKTTLLQRPAMNRLLSDIDSGLIEVVFFKGISRFARDSGETITTAKRLNNKGVRVISLEENYDSSKDDPTMFQIYAVMAEQESRKTGIRVSLGNKAKARRGLWVNPSTPFGYDKVRNISDASLKERLINEGKHPDTLYPNKDAHVVRQAFEMYVHLDYGKKIIASELNKKGYKTESGKMISAKFITDMLANNAYAGDVVYGKTRYEYIENDDMSKKIQKRIEVDKEDWAITRDAHPAIIEREEFDKAIEKQERMKSAYLFAKDFNSAKHPLTGILRCGRCGKGMTCQRRTNKRKDGGVNEYRYYICSTYHTKGRIACSQPNLNAYKLEEKVLSSVKKKISDTINNVDLAKNISKKENNIRQLEDELESINREVAKKVNALQSLVETRDMYDAETFMDLNKNINDGIQKLRKEKENIEDVVNKSKTGSKSIDIEKFVKDFKGLNLDLKTLNAGDMSELRKFFLNTLTEIVIDGKDITNFGVAPFSL